MPTDNRILISGSSIAGLTLAHWLARYGFRPTVVERAPALRSGGNGVDLRGRAIEVAERMGIMEHVRAAATDVLGIRFVDAGDRDVVRVGTRVDDSVEIMRGDLVALLRAAAGDGVEYVLGDSVTALRQDEDGVDVTFEHGPDRRFGLVIGADGMHSNVRRLAFGPESRFLRFKGHYFAFADADPALGENRWVTMYNLPGRMAGIYRSGNHDRAKAYFIFRSEERVAFDHRDVGQQKRLISDAFAADSSWRTADLLATALADPDFYFDALSQVRMESWSTGRVALVGDAAHCASPASGAGAELALVGAYRLAVELAAADGDHALAFGRYRQGHRALVEQKQRIGFNIGLMVPRSRSARWLRNALFRLPLMRIAAAAERLADRGGAREPLPGHPDAPAQAA
ncbi:FAD-dependent monooxygenase [Kitasatospora sp. NPDC057223]|uniref:FAD-dependent monooxygenase n=1 Tax=Kitasatospora sp. NPDC057223 TaxID=3346055 RepID=UPI003624BC35